MMTEACCMLGVNREYFFMRLILQLVTAKQHKDNQVSSVFSLQLSMHSVCSSQHNPVCLLCISHCN